MNKLLGLFLMACTMNVFATDVKVNYGTLHTLEPLASRYVEDRNVHIWLPPGYSRDQAYPVLYMHDGQMLFDPETTWNKTSWNVDDVAGNLIEQGKLKPFIVVGMFNISEIRHADYYPQRAFESLTKEQQQALYDTQRSPEQDMFGKQIQSDNYLKFVVNEVKPFVDSHYSTLTDRANTYVMGSSMGGLISMYAISEYPQVFGGAACLSTHWIGVSPDKGDIASQGFFNYMKDKLPAPGSHKLYFDIGTTTLDQYYPPYQVEADKIVKSKGYDDSNWMSRVFEGAAHTETAWNERLHIPLTFLFGN